MIAEPVTDPRAAIAGMYRELEHAGMAAPRGVRGQLIRPLLAVAGARAIGAPTDARFWKAAAAVQLAHEASLLHDDVIDAAETRRGEPTLAASRGVAAALVEGDHLLTTAYRLAAATERPEFFTAFSRAVERTVAGERMQGRLAGQRLGAAAYRQIIALKSGELLGCALASAALLEQQSTSVRLYALGRRLGAFYQSVDDLLDYCSAAETGKTPFADLRSRRWTWPLLHLADFSFEEPEATVLQRLLAADGGEPPLARALGELEREADMLRAALAVHLPCDEVATNLVEEWLAQAGRGVQQTMAQAGATDARAHVLAQAPPVEQLRVFFERHSRSFSFAAHLFPAEYRQKVERLFAFCRFTDELADGDRWIGDEVRLERLRTWQDMTRSAYQTGSSETPLLELVMRDALGAGVPFSYPAELIEGMRMDVRGCGYDSYDDLRVYTHRVAGVIGQWMTRLAGIDDPWLLQQAATLGNALQLTNILRDVGDDLRLGRVYIPRDALAAFGLSTSDLQRFAEGATVSAAYAALLEDLMGRADLAYAAALTATPRLPAWFGRAVTVAAHVYRGIHDVVRSNGYDNLGLRARTSRLQKVQLAAAALAGASPMSRPAAGPAFRWSSASVGGEAGQHSR